jgi:hypothetical protein
VVAVDVYEDRQRQGEELFDLIRSLEKGVDLSLRRQAAWPRRL